MGTRWRSGDTTRLPCESSRIQITILLTVTVRLTVTVALQSCSRVYTHIPQGLSQMSWQFYGPETQGRYLDEPVPMAVTNAEMSEIIN